MLAGVSTRRFERTREPVGSEVGDRERSTSKSAVSREFVGRTSEHLRALMSRSLVDIRLAALMLDGIELKGRCCVVALGITTDGVKVALGLWDGSTENATVARMLLADLVDRGLDCEQGVLVVLDGAKALRAAVDAVLGPVPLQRCVRHKERNVLDHLAERDRPAIKRRLRAAWKLADHAAALDPRRGAGALAPRRRGVAARGPRRDRDVAATRRPPATLADPQQHEPDRVDDRHLPRHKPQRQALAKRRHVPALDRRRDARSRTPVQKDHRLQAPRRPRPDRRERPRHPPRRSPSHTHHDRHTRGRRLPRRRHEVPRRAGQPPGRGCHGFYVGSRSASRVVGSSAASSISRSRSAGSSWT